MMIDSNLLTAAAALAALGIIAAASLRGWQGWLQFKLRELEQGKPGLEGSANGIGPRIEMADLKERIRKLEAIAAGVDL